MTAIVFGIGAVIVMIARNWRELIKITYMEFCHLGMLVTDCMFERARSSRETLFEFTTNISLDDLQNNHKQIVGIEM